MVAVMDSLMAYLFFCLLDLMKVVYSVEMTALMKAGYLVESTDDYLVVVLDDQTVVEMVDKMVD